MTTYYDGYYELKEKNAALHKKLKKANEFVKTIVEENQRLHKKIKGLAEKR